jgi:nucleoside-diphosphate-sugar epimerase
MKIGITGSTSGLGRRLTEYLLNKNFTLKLLIRNKTKAMEIFGASEKIEYQCGDIINQNDIIDFVKGIDICYHIAAQVDHAPVKQYYLINVDGTKNICEAILNYNNTCKLIYCSSIATLRVTQFNKPLMTDYTKSKYYAEKIVEKYMSTINICIIYPGLIYGPHDRSLLPQLLQGIKRGIPFLISGGEKNVPIIYIDDLVELFFKAGMSEKSRSQKYISVKNSDIGIHGLIQKIADKAKMQYSQPKK